ncbi:MAG: phytanoyl-CoA dioxygenase family protein [Acidimicrobiales bacterium]
MVTERRADPIDGDRELTFVPADDAVAKNLDAEQIEHYNRSGYVSPIDVFTDDEADRLRMYFDDLLDEVVNADDRRNSYSINCYHLVCERLHDLVTEPRIVDLVADIVGPNIVCWGSHLFAKLPGDPKEVPFHQDAVYWPLTPARTVSVWLAIDDADDDNAAMRFVPGSHLRGEIEHVQEDLDGTRVLGRRVADTDLVADPFSNTLRAGQVSLHTDLLLHGSAPNASDRRRAGLTLRYAAADVRLIDGYDFWRKNSVVVRGADPDGFWFDRRRPEGEHPEKMAELWGEFDGQPIDAS